MLTRKRIREMEREGLLDPLTGALPVAAEAEVEAVVAEPRNYDEVLAETGFNLSEAARRLGMHRRTLTRKLEKKQVR